MGARRYLASLPVILMLGGCQAINPLPPPPPTSEQIAAASGAVIATGMKPADYASVGISLAAQGCNDYFGQQLANSQTSAFGQQLLSLAGGAAAAAGGAGVGAATSLLSSVMGSAQATLGVSASPVTMWGLEKRMQAAWLSAMHAPMTDADALAMVQSFAEECSLPNILWAGQTAINSATVTAAPQEPAQVVQVAQVPAPSAPPPRKRLRTATPAEDRLEAERQAIARYGRATVEGGRVPLPVVRVGP